MNPSAPAISISRLHKTFAKRRRLGELVRHPFRRGESVQALRDVSLEVDEGEVFGLLGPNGAGKTTLLKILSCLVLPDGGEARINGHDTADDEMAVKRSIGYVTSDERSFYWRLSGAQNLVFFARLYRVPRDHIRPRVQVVLDRMELTHKADEPFSSYSSGMKQRLSIARALLHDPPILFLDEPTRSLDPVTARHIREFVRDELAARQGKTILLATHNLHEAAELCARMAILSNGRVQRVGRLDEFHALFQAGRRYRLVTDRVVALDGIARVIESAPEHSPTPGADRVTTRLEVEDDLSPLLRCLTASEARVFELTRETPSLEDLFQHLFAEGHAADAQGDAS